MTHARKPRLVLPFILAFLLLGAPKAHAVPSFSTQTGQPCSACHVGSFGPQLTPFGRAFKLGGYTMSGGEDHDLPLDFMIQGSLTSTRKSQNPPPVRGYSANNNFSLDQISAFYAGAVSSSVGAFIQATYDGVNDVFHWDNADIRYAHAGNALGIDYTAGVTFNNGPTIQDLWNSIPAWGFPYASSGLAPSPAASTLIDNNLSQLVLGGGVYADLNDWVYLETDAYRGLSRNVLNGLGSVPTSGNDEYSGFIPYWRLALHHDFNGEHSVEFGAYGLSADRYPGGDETTGMKDTLVDTAFDANYQWVGDPDNIVSFHTTYIHENQALNASYALGNSANQSNRLNTFRADASYSYKGTYTPSLQYFDTHGTADSLWWQTSTGSASPNSQGYVVELAYAPFGHQDSSVLWGNARIALQYVGYTEFDGTSHNASNNNTIFLNLWMTLDPVAAAMSK